jgi:hypothetical protein
MAKVMCSDCKNIVFDDNGDAHCFLYIVYSFVKKGDKQIADMKIRKYINHIDYKKLNKNNDCEFYIQGKKSWKTGEGLIFVEYEKAMYIQNNCIID